MNRPRLLDLFIVANLGFLVLDVYLAHSMNAFHHRGEWVPFYFSLLGTVWLGLSLVWKLLHPSARSPASDLLVGVLALGVGLVGFIWHLDSQFFQQLSLKSLVYTAPLVAPLAYAGLGFLILLGRMVDSRQTEWGQWVVFFAWGGFVGNFLLSVLDHEQNGFFYWDEWIPVFASALAVGFLLLAVLRPGDRKFLRVCLWLMALQAAVGLLGFGLHLHANLTGPTQDLWTRVVFGAPVFAPLLFPNLAILGALGLWDLLAKAGESEAAGRVEAGVTRA